MGDGVLAGSGWLGGLGHRARGRVVTVVELMGAVLGGGTLTAIAGTVGTVLAARRTERTEAKKDAATVEVAHVSAATDALNLMSALIGEMRGERARLIEEAEKARLRTEAKAEEHRECLELVSGLAGRVEILEVEGQRRDVKLEDCETKHAEARVLAETAARELATFKRSVTSELAKRPPSNPGFPKAGG